MTKEKTSIKFKNNKYVLYIIDKIEDVAEIFLKGNNLMGMSPDSEKEREQYLKKMDKYISNDNSPGGIESIVINPGQDNVSRIDSFSLENFVNTSGIISDENEGKLIVALEKCQKDIILEINDCVDPKTIKESSTNSDGYIEKISYETSEGSKEINIVSKNDASKYVHNDLRLLLINDGKVKSDLNKCSRAAIDIFAKYYFNYCIKTKDIQMELLNAIWRNAFIDIGLNSSEINKLDLFIVQKSNCPEQIKEKLNFIPIKPWSKDSGTGKGKMTWVNPDESYEGDFVDGNSHGKGVYTWKSGTKYEGDFVDGKQTGKGVYTWSDGDKYEGDFVDGNFHGKGIKTWSDGDKYEGDWVDDKRTGKGVFTWSDGNKYEGDFVENKRTGKGVYTSSNGDKYEGDFVDGKQNGKGKLTLKNGTKIEGDWVNGKCTGKGKMTWVNPDESYEGDFVENKRTGKGIHIFPNGSKYEGDFVEGRQNGKGLKTWKNGDKYEGDFVDGKQTGKGLKTWKNGDKYEGDFVDGKQTGKGVYTWENGNKYEGDFVELNFHGKGVYTWSDGDKYEGDFVDDKRTGKGVYTHSNGDKYEGDFVDGNFHGKGVFTWSDSDMYEGEFKEQNPQKISNEFTLNYKPNLSSKDIRELLNTESVGSSKIDIISKREGLDDLNREIVNLKVKIATLIQDNESSENAQFLQDSLLSNTDWGKEVFEALYQDKNPDIRNALAMNPSLPESILSILFKDEENRIRLTVLSNPSCPKAILISGSEDTENYASSRIRRSIALNVKTPKDIILKFLQDEYRWVREAAASNELIKKEEISGLVKNGDRYILKGLLNNPNTSEGIKTQITGMLNDKVEYPIETDRYVIETNSWCGEYVGDSMTVEEMAEAITEHEDYELPGDWYQYDGIYHYFGDYSLHSRVQLPDGTTERLNLEIKSSITDNGTDFVMSANTAESGNVDNYELELEELFDPDKVTIDESDGLVHGYEYGDYDVFEGSPEGESTPGHGYNTPDLDIEVKMSSTHYDSFDFAGEIQEMEDAGIDSGDYEAVLKTLKDKYGF